MKVITNMLKGLIIGGSMSVPGVSGGTMAILLGCYDELIHSVSSFLKDIKKNALFLLQFCAGSVLGLFLISKILAKGLENDFAREPLLCFFVGVVLGGIPIMYRQTKSSLSRKRDYIFCLLGLLIVVPLGFIPENVLNLAKQTGPTAVIFLLIAGFIVAIALVLPGISTTLMLAALGMYKTSIDAISNVDLPFLIPLVMGVLIGTFSTTKFLESLMSKYPRKTYLLIIGFVLGSVYEVLPNELPENLLAVLLCVAAVPLGFALITFVSKMSKNSGAA